MNGGILIFGGINIYRNNDKFYEEILMPMFRIFGAETAHTISIKLAKYNVVPRPSEADPSSLVCHFCHDSLSTNLFVAMKILSLIDMVMIRILEVFEHT